MINKHPDDITYWKKGGVDYMGQPQWDGPYVDVCRWEDEERLFITDNGREERGRSTLYAATDFLEIGDYVYQGLSAETSPPTGSFEVKQPRKIKNLRGTKVEYRYIV